MKHGELIKVLKLLKEWTGNPLFLKAIDQAITRLRLQHRQRWRETGKLELGEAVIIKTVHNEIGIYTPIRDDRGVIELRSEDERYLPFNHVAKWCPIPCDSEVIADE